MPQACTHRWMEMARFERDLDDVFGYAMRLKSGEDLRQEWWSALANITWYHDDGATFDASFRSAGTVIANISEDGSDYMDYYCQSEAEIVSDRIASGMALKGWTFKKYESNG